MALKGPHLWAILKTYGDETNTSFLIATQGTRPVKKKPTVRFDTLSV